MPREESLYPADWLQGAAESLGEIGDERAVESLVAALKDSNQVVRKTVAEALDKLAAARRKLAGSYSW